MIREFTGALAALAVVFAVELFAAPQALAAEGSVSSLRMGMGARDAEAMRRFDAVIAQYNASGERFRIDSHCQSACTMFLSIRNVCVVPSATLLFHAGGNMRSGTISAYSTQHMLDAYNPALRKYVTDNRNMDTFTFHSISGRDIVGRFGYPACK